MRVYTEKYLKEELPLAQRPHCCRLTPWQTAEAVPKYLQEAHFYLTGRYAIKTEAAG